MRRRNPDNRELIIYAGLGLVGLCLGRAILGNVPLERGYVHLTAGAAAVPALYAITVGKGGDAGSAALAGLGGVLAVGLLAKMISGEGSVSTLTSANQEGQVPTPGIQGL